ncbi:MAG TPA: reverse transcriptase-like protein [Candidatus Acidoferrum sp.]|nr:reverse transcriptase-like protein [Candidatus Acidoferrum sp.]
MTARRRDTLPARLFSEPDHPTDIFTAEVDGASRGNPGPASYAVIIRRPDGSTVYQLGKYLGRATNNVAEYFALITALDYCASSNIHRLRVRSDSELLVRQMQGRYKVKSASLKPLHERALRQSKSMAYFAIEHVPRELNSDADALANSALDRTGEIGSSVRVLSGATRAASASAGTAGNAQCTIRAKYKDGVLHPTEALDLEDGAEVEIVVRQTKKD